MIFLYDFTENFKICKFVFGYILVLEFFMLKHFFKAHKNLLSLLKKKKDYYVKYVALIYFAY